MSLFGFLVRWGSMGLGAMLIAASVQSSLQFKPRDESAVAMSPDQVLALSGTTGDAFVQIDARLDPSTRVYDSCLNRPAFTTTDTNPIYNLDLDREDPAEELIGTTVAAHHPLMDGRIECQVVVERGGTDKQVQSYRILSPFQDTGGVVWVLSPRFYGEQDGDRWHASGSYRGPLSRFDDLKFNSTDLSHDASEIRAFARNELNFEIPADALVILDGNGRTPGEAPKVSFAAVEGTDGRLVVQCATPDLPIGTIQGMVEARPSDHTATLATMMGSASPGRAMLIDTTRTAASENARDVLAMRAGLIGGVVLLVFGAGTTALKIAIRRGRRRGLDRAMAGPFGAQNAMAHLSPQQAMALGIPTPGAMAAHRYTPGPQGASRPATGAHGAAYSTPSNPYAQGQPTPGAGTQGQGAPSDHDAALEAEMARWTDGQSGGNRGSRAA